MIVGFSSHGQGSAAGPISYLTDRVRGGIDRQPAPTVLRGDPSLVADLIDGSAFAHRYTSGVLSFAPGEQISAEMEATIMDRFEAAAFAGLDSDQYAILWVRHEHAGHHELNFLVPRVELSTGKSLNIAPPGRSSRELFDAFRTAINLEYGLADPDDPARAREVHVPAHIAKLRVAEIRAGRSAGDDPREVIASAIGREIASGHISDREHVLGFLRDAGFEISREGQDYISVRDTETNDKYRLKGPYFHAGFQAEQLARAIERRSIDFERSTDERLAECRESLERFIKARGSYNQRRYQNQRSDLWLGRDRDLREISQELSPENRYEREVLETDWVRHDGFERIAVGAFSSRSLAGGGGATAASGALSIENDDGGTDASRRIRGTGGPDGQVPWNPESHPGQQPLRLCESSLPLRPSEEPLNDDRARTSPIERLRAFGQRVLHAGERLARSISDFATGLQRLFTTYDDAITEHNEVMLGFDRARERFELTARAISERLERLTASLDLGRARDATDDAELKLGIER